MHSGASEKEKKKQKKQIRSSQGVGFHVNLLPGRRKDTCMPMTGAGKRMTERS